MKCDKFQNIAVDSVTKQRLEDKNKKLIDMVIERAKRDFPNDIALIALTGSFSTGNFHEKSDLDLIIINNTAEGWGIADGFIFADVGYDLYCNSWQSIEDAIKNNGVTSIIDWQVFYYAKLEYLEKFNSLKAQVEENLKLPINKDCLDRAKKHIDLMKQYLSEVFLSDDVCKVKYASGCLLANVVTTLVRLNNSYIKRGIRRDMVELLSYKFLPNDFEKSYMAVVNANTIDELRDSSTRLAKSVVQLYETMLRDLVEQPKPTHENLRGTYEECWCNLRNKIIRATAIGDALYAFDVAVGAQAYFDEMTEERGTVKINLMQYFDANNLDIFKDAFLEAMEKYRAEYDKVGRKIARFDTYEELYNYYMDKGCRA